MSDIAPLDDEKSCMLLVMRVLSIVPLNFKVCFAAWVTLLWMLIALLAHAL